MNYVVGDIQGCYRGLRSLLKKVQFNPQQDKLWAVGDLVARGDDSLSTLEFLYDLGDAFFTVLGNHDLHLLSVINEVKKPKVQDNLAPLLLSPRIEQFADWLRQFPLAYQLDETTLLTHAGLYPKWSFDDALHLSRKVQKRLAKKDYAEFLPVMYSSKPQVWNPSENKAQRLVFAINAMTRMRFVNSQCALDFDLKCAPDDAPAAYQPWFKVNNEQTHADQRVIFGHWASLQGQTRNPNYIALDTGYVWGGYLSCYCLETQTIHRVSA